MLGLLGGMGRLLQVIVFVGMLILMGKASGDPGKMGEVCGRILVYLLLLEALIRGTRPKSDSRGESEAPSTGNYLSGGCLGLVLLGGVSGLVIGLKGGAPTTPLAEHKGPARLYKIRVPEGAKFKKQNRTEKSEFGNFKVSGEAWEHRNEGGAAGVIDVPMVMKTTQSKTYVPANQRAYRGDYSRSVATRSAMSDDEILDILCNAQVEAISGVVSQSKPISRVGYHGREVEFVIKEKKMRGMGVYLWASRSIYFSVYLAPSRSWDDRRARSILSSFSFSPFDRK